MNIFLVGNGFDLHHKFPTRYIDFLHTMGFLIQNKDETYTTIGKIFGNEDLQQANSFIQECYEQHQHIYNSTALDNNKIQKLISTANNNMWFKYLQNCVSKDIGWIDFEKEVLRVLNAFEEFFKSDDDKLALVQGKITFDGNAFPPNAEDRYILSQFGFFFEESDESWVGCSRAMHIKEEYSVEKIVGSETYYVKTEEVVTKLYTSLRELANILRDYLLIFVDGPSKEYEKFGFRPRFSGLPIPNRVYSFNYTNTCEILYNNNTVDHIHGNTNTNIVLGINPDEKDEFGSIDTTFLQFKKYFQRVFYNTDIEFLRSIDFSRMTPRSNDNNLTVIGHSLDSTDEDIIRQIFHFAKTIKILYHSETSVKNQIENLIKIYGKDGFDSLRQEKQLYFFKQGEIRWEVENN